MVYSGAFLFFLSAKWLEFFKQITDYSISCIDYLNSVLYFSHLDFQSFFFSIFRQHWNKFSMTITNKQNCKTSGFFLNHNTKNQNKNKLLQPKKKIQWNSCTILSNPKITLQIYFFELKLYEFFFIYMYISIYVNIHVFLKYSKLFSLHHLHLSSRNALLNKVPIY